MKRLHAITRSGTTFGMEVDGVQARRVINSAKYQEIMNPFGTARKKLCIRSNQLATLLREAAWLVTEKQDFIEVSFDEDPYRYVVIYPEVK